MTQPDSDLRHTSDALLDDLDQLEALEQQKRQLDPGDPRLVELAAAVEVIARRVLGRSVRQRVLSSVAHELAVTDSPGAPSKPIAETPRELHRILADWREAERRVQAAAPGSPEALEAADDAERFRDEYRAAQDADRGR